MYTQMSVAALFDLEHTAAAPLLQGKAYPWEALPQIAEFIRELGASLPPADYEQREESVWISRSAQISPLLICLAPLSLDRKPRCVTGRLSGAVHW